MNFKFDDIKRVKEIRIKSKLAKLIPTIKTEDNPNDVIAMNLKFLGRNIDKFYCKKHLQEILNIDNKQWNKYIEQFKQQNCNLF